MVLAQFDHDPVSAQRAYQEFVLSSIGRDSPWEEVKGRIILGKDDFIADMKKLFQKRDISAEISHQERFAGRPKLSELCGKITEKSLRDEKIYIAHVQFGYRLKEIGNFLGIHYSTVSKIIKRVKAEKNLQD